MLMYKKLKKQHPEIITPMYTTLSGGLHMIFQYDSDIKTKLRIKIDDIKVGWDILSDKHIAVCPPSNGYKWKRGMSFNDISIIKMPKWLKNIILNCLLLTELELILTT